MKSSSIPHRPHFDWRNRTIWDRGEAIARLEWSAPAAGRPVRLTGMRLEPHGRELAACILAKSIAGSSANCVRRVTRIGTHAAQLKLRLELATADGMFRAVYDLLVRYDARRASYCYALDFTLDTIRLPGRCWRDLDMLDRSRVPLEYANLVPLGACNFFHPVASGGKRWQAFLYRDREGIWRKVPHHHLMTPDKYNLQFDARRGALGFFDDPDGNPGIVLSGDTARDTVGELCWAMHDVHLRLTYVPLCRRYRASCEIVRFTRAAAARLMRQAVPRPFRKSELEAFNLPRFDGRRLCDFSRGFNLRRADASPCFWLPLGDITYTRWRRHGERARAGCLETRAPRAIAVAWQLESTNAVPVRPGVSHQIEVWTRTRALTGRGLGVEAWYANSRRVFRSRWLYGTNPGTRLTVNVPADPRRAAKLNIRLIHEGKGDSWFDTVRLKERSDPPCKY